MTARRRRAIAGLVVALSSVVVLSSPASPVSAAGETGLVSIDPARLLDTRSGSTTIDGTGSGGGPTEAGVPVVVDVVGRGGVPADGVSAVVVNVTVDNSATANAGYVTVYPTGDPTPLASSLNFAAGAVVANEVIAKVGANGTISIVTQLPTQLVVDIVGWVPTSGSGYTPSAPRRYLDTRSDGVTFDGVARSGGSTVAGGVIDLAIAGRGDVPVSATAVVVNVTVDNSATMNAGYVTVFPTGTVRPLASSLNLSPGQVVANELVTKVGAGGRISLFTQPSTHLIVDVVGWFVDVGAGGLHPLAPARLLDTRAGTSTVDGLQQGAGPTTAGRSLRLPVLGRGGVPPSGVWAVVVNVTVPASVVGGGFVTVHPNGSTRPNASSLNTAAGRVVANEVIAKVGAGGAIRLFTQFGSDLVVDVVGWLPSPGGDAGEVPLPAEPPISGPRVQAIYAVPAGIAAVAGREAAIAHEVGVVQAWYDGQTGGRHPVFARVAGGGSGISVIRVDLTSTEAALTATTDPEALIDAQVRAQLGAALDDASLAVVLEGQTGGSFCGRTGTMVLIPIANCDIAPSSTSTWPYEMSYLLGHELTHLLGAVDDCSPHADGTGHVSDDRRDVLYSGPSARDWLNLQLDPGHDDYYLHDVPGCADIADSPLLDSL